MSFCLSHTEITKLSAQGAGCQPGMLNSSCRVSLVLRGPANTTSETVTGRSDVIQGPSGRYYLIWGAVWCDRGLVTVRSTVVVQEACSGARDQACT